MVTAVLLAALAAPRLALVGPAALPADGAATARFTLTVDPPADVEASADAGTLAVKAVAPGRFTVEYTAPRLAVPMEATLLATAAGGRAEAKVRLTPPEAGAEEARSGGPLDLRAPGRLLIGGSAEAWVSVARRAGPPPRLVASVGALGPLGDAPGGRLRARYTPPDTRMPQVAIVAALDDAGAVVDWIALPLDGRPRVDTRTKPNARVSVRVAGVEFGPVQADRQGRATLTVIAPPGVADSTTVAADRLGNRTEAPLGLGAPPPNRLLALCAPARVTVLSVDAAGRPRAAPIVAAAAAGVLGPLVERAPGRYEAEFRLPPGGDPIAITARADDDAASRASCAVVPPPAVLVALDVAVDRAEWAPGGGPVEVTVTPRWDRPPARAAEVALATDLGALSPQRLLPDGRITARWTFPDGAGPARATVTARAGERSAAAQVALQAAPPRARPRVAVAAHLGYLTNFARVQAPFAAAELAVRLPPWRRAISLGLLVGWWGASTSGTASDGSERVDASISTVPLLARAAVQLPLERVGVYLGATGGALVVRSAASSPSAGTSAATDVVGAGGGFVAADLHLGPGRLGAEVAYLYGALSGGAVSGNVAGLAATLAYRLEFAR